MPSSSFSSFPFGFSLSGTVALSLSRGLSDGGFPYLSERMTIYWFLDGPFFVFSKNGNFFPSSGSDVWVVALVAFLSHHKASSQNNIVVFSFQRGVKQEGFCSLQYFV